MPVFLERFVLGICATAFITVLVNPMKFGLSERLLLGVLILAVAGVSSYTVQKDKVKENPPAQNPPGVQNTSTTQTPPPVVNVSAQVTVPIQVAGDHFQKVFVVRVGGYQDFMWSSKIRIEIKALKHMKPPGRSVLGGDQDHAEIYVSSEGGLVYGGEETTRTGVNKYLVPVKFTEQETRSVFFFHTADGYFRFFRVLVDHINVTTGEVTLDACFVRLFNPPSKTSI
jgi:hypothetical protein